MRMRLGDMELDMRSMGSEQSAIRRPAERDDPAGIGHSLQSIRDVANLPRAVFIGAGFLAVGVAFVITAAAFGYQAWLALLPVPFLARFAVYALILGLRQEPQSNERPPAHDVLRALGKDACTIDELALRLGWSERRTVEAVVNLIDAGQLEEDLDLESGHWFYARPSADARAIEHSALSATERLQALEPVAANQRSST